MRMLQAFIREFLAREERRERDIENMNIDMVAVRNVSISTQEQIEALKVAEERYRVKCLINQ